MYYVRAIILAVLLLAALDAAAWADDPPAKLFIPLTGAHNAIQGGLSAPPHFFPLRAKPIGKFIPHINNAAAQTEDVPTFSEHPGIPEKMTQEQAQQILSIFGGGE